MKWLKEIFTKEIYPDLKWLIGRSFAKVEKKDYSWFFNFDDGSTIATHGSPWRLIAANRIATTSEDDGQMFGLPAPVSAAARVNDAIGQNQIVWFELKNNTGDLIIHFSNNTSLEFLNLSSGHEAWCTCHGEQKIFCLGGGELSIFSDKNK